MPAAKPTEAAIARAIRAARREGCGVVEIRDGAIRILVAEAPAALPSADQDTGDEAACDALFGVPAGRSH